MWVLIEVGSLIGALPTITLVLLTAMVGVALLRREGLSTLVRGHRKLDQGELPAQEMIEGLILAICGALLLTPGFVTDFVGFLGLIPFSRQWFVRKLISNGSIDSFYHSQTHSRENAPAREDRVIEGEFWEKDK